MLLVIDIGNSSIKIGLFKEGEARPLVRRLPTRPALDAPGYGTAIRDIVKAAGAAGGRVLGLATSSVVPEVDARLVPAAEEMLGLRALRVGGAASGGMRLAVREPMLLGPDRIAGAAGAVKLLGAPCVSIDLGTATTVNFVGPGGEFQGGAILPGMGLMLRALAEETALLPELSPALHVLPIRPIGPIGNDTVEAMLSGAVIGTAGAVERIIALAGGQTGTTYKIAVTGGYMEVLRPHLGRAAMAAMFEPDLTLIGLRAIHLHSEGRTDV